MLPALNLFAESGPAVHVSPETLFYIGNWPITNSVLYGWIAAICIVTFLVLVARKVTVKPKGGVIQLVEYVTDFITNLVENAFDDKKIGRKYVPFFVTIFFIVLLNNWLGLIPIVGEGLQYNGHPIFRPFTGDLNATFAIGLFTMVYVYYASVKEAGGARKYFRNFFIGSPANPLYFAIGLIEMFTDFTRVLSLSLRLFLNITIGEIVIAVFAYLGSVAAPITALPFTLLEIGVGALQAYIFTILATMYLAIAVNHANEHSRSSDEHADLTDDKLPGTMKAQSTGAANG